MRLSIIISNHNEGAALLKTIESCINTVHDLSYEIILADDVSTQGSFDAARARYPQLRIASNPTRLGVSPTKDLGARTAIGDILLFLDAHCKPENHAIERLVNSVEDTDGKRIIVPRVPSLDCESWQSDMGTLGGGYRLKNLDRLEMDWTNPDNLEREGTFYRSPALCGCCVTVSRTLYDKLLGFDPHMYDWGYEDIDFGLKAWLMGFEILVNPHATIGHRFGSNSEYSICPTNLIVNRMRLARKNFHEATWTEWLNRTRASLDSTAWDSAWAAFSAERESLELERDFLLSRRVRTEFHYARTFGLDWPLD